jgi:hypothetical protein
MINTDLCESCWWILCHVFHSLFIIERVLKCHLTWRLRKSESERDARKKARARARARPDIHRSKEYDPCLHRNLWKRENNPIQLQILANKSKQRDQRMLMSFHGQTKGLHRELRTSHRRLRIEHVYRHILDLKRHV